MLTKPKVDHYDRAEIQPIDFVQAWFSQPEFNGFTGYCAGNVIKYLCRLPFKGRALDDLYKARTYLNWLIEDAKKSTHRRWRKK